VRADFVCGTHRIEHATDNLRRPRPTFFVSSLLLQKLGVRKDDPELIVQLVEEVLEFPRLFHGAPFEQICN
jgi:hypothetical protein